MNILIILGADRVGKSTLVSRVCDFFEPDTSCRTLHFSGPKPHHLTPICQYLDELKALPPDLDWVVCDRGGPEVCFYEKFRRNVALDSAWAVEFEKYLSAHYEVIKMVLLQRNWEWSLPRHVEEINELYPGCSDFWFMSQLKVRQLEHHSYYQYMHQYFSEVSMFEPVVLNTNELDHSEIRKLLSV